MTTEADLFAPDGTPYVGEVALDAKGKPSGTEFVVCGRCGGSGKWKRRLECFSCGGDGGKDKPVRLYTEPQLAKLQVSRDRRTAAKVAKEIERADRIEANYLAYRAERLPLFEAAEASGNRFLADLVAKAREWGSLTESQSEAMVRVVGEIEASRATYAGSKPFADPGQRVDVEVTCTKAGSFRRKAFKGRRMETVHVTEMVDGLGNAFVSVTSAFSLKAGQRAAIRATVKAHDETRGWACTVLNRVAVVSMLRAAPKALAAPPEPEPEFVPSEDFAALDDECQAPSPGM